MRDFFVDRVLGQGIVLASGCAVAVDCARCAFPPGSVSEFSGQSPPLGGGGSGAPMLGRLRFLRTLG